MEGLRGRIAAASEAVRDVLRNGDIGRLQAGWTLGIAADWALLVTILVAAYDDGGAPAVGLLGVVRMLPATAVTLLLPIPSWLSRERLLVVINALRAAGAATAGVGLLIDGPLVLLFAAATLTAASGVLVRPTQVELLPALARSPEELIAANVATSMGEGLGTLSGPIAGAILVATVGPAGTCMVTGVAFVLTAVVVAGIRVHRAGGGPGVPAVARNRPPIAEGLATLIARPSAGAIIGNFIAQSFVRGLLTTLIVIVALELLAMGEAGVGWLNAAIGLGGFIGAVVALGLARSTRLAPAFALSLTGWGIPIAMIGLVPVAWLALVALVVVGLSNAVEDVTGFTLLQRTVPNRLRAAVLAIMEGSAGFAVGAGSAVAPLLVAVFGTVEALAIAGAIMPVFAVLTWPLISRLDDQEVIPRRELQLLRGVPMFSLLPLTTIEGLATNLQPVDIPAGHVLMREGAEGDRFYVVASGSLCVTQAGTERRRLGSGDGVGEIALLRSMPRTATVTAETDSRLYALDSRTFLEAVTGHPRSSSEANRLVAERLAPDG